MATRKEMQNELNLATANALEAMRAGMDRGCGYSSRELSVKTKGFLSEQSVAMFMRKNSGQSYFDNGGAWVNANGIITGMGVKRSTKTYINVEDPDDVITIERKEALWGVR